MINGYFPKLENARFYFSVCKVFIMSIQKEFILRYRTEGHIRFQVPARICDAAVAKILSEDILVIEGVYRVHLYRGQRKLSIRFNESVCDFKTLVKQLFELLALLEEQDLLTPRSQVEMTASSPSLKSSLKEKLAKTKWGQWGKEQYTAAKETLQAAKIVGKVGMKKQSALIKNPEQTIIDFLNDILVLYLIRLHWHNITQHWIVNPFKHRYEWSAVFYLFYLLMRSRKPK